MIKKNIHIILLSILLISLIYVTLTGKFLKPSSNNKIDRPEYTNEEERSGRLYDPPEED